MFAGGLRFSDQYLDFGDVLVLLYLDVCSMSSSCDTSSSVSSERQRQRSTPACRLSFRFKRSGRFDHRGTEAGYFTHESRCENRFRYDDELAVTGVQCSIILLASESHSFSECANSLVV